jgi:hypothetical protein
MDWLLIIGVGGLVILGEALAVAISVWIFDVNPPSDRPAERDAPAVRVDDRHGDLDAVGGLPSPMKT